MLICYFYRIERGASHADGAPDSLLRLPLTLVLQRCRAHAPASGGVQRQAGC